MTEPLLRAYVAVPGREGELLDELHWAGAQVIERFERLVWTKGGPTHAAWASNVWLAPERIQFAAIKEATEALLQRQSAWSLLSLAHHRRAALIQQGCSVQAPAPLSFGERPPTRALGSWALLTPDTLLASPRCSSKFPNGKVEFVPDPEPPSRAYLKLWELFTLTGRMPQPGELCLDLGSSPGGWTWVLAKLGARVLSVDKAPLDPKVAHLKGVSHKQLSAFALDPAAHPPVDWLLSDMICYPDKLCDYIERWLASGKVKNFVCTLKFQAETDHEAARRFARIPGSRLAHLHHNKHELTWWRFAK